ncbi:LPS assembly lipoprotein LptE [Pelomonas sp. CA6]|uniref:LPS-assembly lipoprotein LptE n=1 Tax=Pelomonas sp. CA6 TaxID=2907999 RepID=UPI001F4BF1D3|nr:LPS assembly lipoprotein LptE [Pelomonas sp. CA6]MCH7343481.1 LPS assembly lipoprotein LptE [Pelomonas sp. CA6]
MRRRQLLQALVPALAAPLAGCGFELRKEPEFQFRTLALAGFAPASPLARELRRQLERTPLQLLEDPNRAEVVLEARRDWRDKSAVVTTSAGQVREWQLRLSLDYQIRSAAGEILLPQTELRLARDMNYTESAALAKEQEEATLYRAMQYEAVGLLLRRLAAVRLPG